MSTFTWPPQGSGGGGGSGTVTSVSVNTGNGFSGSVADPNTTPIITISTTVDSPVLAGDGTNILPATTTGSGSTVVLAEGPVIDNATITGFVEAEATFVFPSGAGITFQAGSTLIIPSAVSISIGSDIVLTNGGSLTSTSNLSSSVVSLTGPYQPASTGPNVFLPYTVIGDGSSPSFNSAGVYLGVAGNAYEEDLNYGMTADLLDLQNSTPASSTVSSFFKVGFDGTVTASKYGVGAMITSSAGVVSVVAPGTSGNVLTSTGGAWVSSPGGGGTSYTFADSIVNTSGTVTLVGDSASPGNNQFYGTNASGVKNWYSLPSGTGTVTSFSFTNGANLTGTVTNSTSSPALSLAPTSTTPTATSFAAWDSSKSLSALGFLLDGSSSGIVSILPQASAGTYNFNLPTGAGSSGQVLTSQGGGSTAMTWTTPATGTVTSVATGTGLTGGPITTTGTLSLATIAANTVLGNTSGSTAVPSAQALGTMTESTSSVLTLSGWADATLGSPTIQVKQASTSVSGYLSSTDWTTFNNKQSALTFSDSLVNTSGTVTLSGDSASPGNSQYYGTNGSGTKGFYSISSGTVTSISVASSNGFAGSSSGGSTPVLTVSTTITAAVLAGNGTAISAATTTGTGSTVVLATAPTMSNPVVGTQSTTDNSTKAASTAYVTTAIANAIAGINPAVAVQAATVSSSDTSGFTYNNGVAGVGATFTGSTNTAVTIDGFTFTALGQRLLVKNDTQSPSGAFNGIYYVTQLQTVGLPPILTRSLDFDTASDINNTGAIPVVNGTVNATTSWVVTSTVNTVGTDPITFTQFTMAPSSYLLKSNNLSDVSSKSTSFNTISPMTTSGDMIYGGTSGSGTRIGIGSTGNILTVSGGVPTWAAPATSGTVTAVSVATANGFAGSSSGGATPSLTVSTTITAPVLSGNGTAIAAATTTGTGSTVVLSTSPTLVTPTLGAASATSLSLSTALTVANGGTGLATLTQYYLLVGAGTSSVTLVAPSSTSGIPLISQGGSANPVYGTTVVAGGGTGITTATAYSVICGGITSTGAFQSVSGVGTLGQVLTSNGGGALPTWQAGGGGTSYTFADSIVNTSGTVTLVNDSATPGNNKVYGTNGSGVLGWQNAGGGGSYTVPTQQRFTSTGTQTGVFFDISTSTTCAIGDTYTSNGNTYTVLVALSAQSGWVLFMSGTGSPTSSGTSGTLSRATGSGTSSVSFTNFQTMGTYTTPSSVLYLKVRMIAAGGGAAGSGTSTNGAGAAGYPSVFGSNLLITLGGSGGATTPTNGTATTAGGTFTINSPAFGTGFPGGSSYASVANGNQASTGGRSGWGTSNFPTLTTTAAAQPANTGSGGNAVFDSAGSTSSGTILPGGAGGFVDALVGTPSGTYYYSCGAGGTGGAAGSGGNVGGAGSSGYLEITEFYQ